MIGLKISGRAAKAALFFFWNYLELGLTFEAAGGEVRLRKSFTGKELRQSTPAHTMPKPI